MLITPISVFQWRKEAKKEEGAVRKPQTGCRCHRWQRKDSCCSWRKRKCQWQRLWSGVCFPCFTEFHCYPWRGTFWQCIQWIGWNGYELQRKRISCHAKSRRQSMQFSSKTVQGASENPSGKHPKIFRRTCVQSGGIWRQSIFKLHASYRHFHIFPQNFI